MFWAISVFPSFINTDKLLIIVLNLFIYTHTYIPSNRFYKKWKKVQKNSIPGRIFCPSPQRLWMKHLSVQIIFWDIPPSVQSLNPAGACSRVLWVLASSLFHLLSYESSFVAHSQNEEGPVSVIWNTPFPLSAKDELEITHFL